MSDNLKRTRLLGFALLVGFGIAAWYFLLAPRIEEPTLLESTANEAITQKSLLDTQVAVLQRRGEYLKKAEAAAAQLESRFPWQPDVPMLIQQVQEAALRAGMSTSQVLSVIPGKPTSEGILIPQAGGNSKEPSAAETDPSAEDGTDTEAPAPKPEADAVPVLAKMDVNIVVVGTYEQVTNFLTELRQSNRVIVVNSVQVVPSAAADEAPGTTSRFQANIAAYAVLLPKPPQPPQVPKKDSANPGPEQEETESPADSADEPTTASN